MSELYRARSAPCIFSLELGSVEESLGLQRRTKNLKCADEYQQFEICHERSCILNVRIIQGLAITRGRIKDWLYRADPYVKVNIVGTPNQAKQTKHVQSSNTPRWDETLQFYVDPYRDRFVEFTLYDLNRTVNEEIGRDILDISQTCLEVDETIVTFKNGSKIQVKLTLEKNLASEMRFDLSLCSEEQLFIKKRDPKVLMGLNALIKKQDLSEKGEDDPHHLSFGSLEDQRKLSSESSIRISNEALKSGMTSSISFDGLCDDSSTDETQKATGKFLPKVGLITSGGGFRAMIAYSGANKALLESGILDCIHYAGALSGSSWYLSTLYNHPEFPRPEAVQTIIEELKSCVEKHWQVHLSPPWSTKYLKKIIRKSISGQPVGFTDFFGYLVGEQLLRGKMKSKLSDQKVKIEEGEVAMPMYTCIHVKKNVSAKIFQEWYEFTPYEVCIPKYGISIPIQKFGSKFYMGNPITDHKEFPLHYFYGIWGSAFTILFKRFIQEKGRGGQQEILKILSSEEGLKEINQETSSILEETKRRESIVHDFNIDLENDMDESDDEESAKESEPETPDDYHELISNPQQTSPFLETCMDSNEGTKTKVTEETTDDEIGNCDETETDSPIRRKMFRSFTLRPTKGTRRISLSKKFEKIKENFTKKGNSVDETAEHIDTFHAKDENGCLALEKDDLDQELSRVDKYLEKALSSNPIDSRAGRAGLIHNPLRGLTVFPNFPEENCYSPTKPSDQVDFKGYKEHMKLESKKIYLVDSGLSFNFPFPIMLRPQRGILFYIAFDFSSRESDSTHPFRELLLSEKWARLHKIKFPNVKEQVKEYIDQPIQECYVFKDTQDIGCPVIIFFPLINKDFREFSAPGVRRETEEEIKFAEFDLFDNTSDYAIWRFVYPNLSFDRLYKMMEFNVLNNIHIIKTEFREFIDKHGINLS